ncbi:MAG: methyltransferase domain-containing protein [Myxococcales bacterium]|nr:methyltransferase domain-containing protein [Myxococcales bacterium]
MPHLRLSRSLSWHARDEAAFSWHRLTGDVCEMSRDVVALCLAFAEPSEVDAVCAARPGGLEPDQARQFCTILRERLILEELDRPIEEVEAELAARRPYTPKLAVYQRRGADAVVYGRAGGVLVEGAARFLDAADGSRPLGELAPPERWPALLRLCAADLAALKLLPPGRGLPRWSDSTMPWPEAAPEALAGGARPAVGAADPSDLPGYHEKIGDAALQFDEVETTLSHLFREPHPSLGGATFGARLAAALIARGAPPTAARVLEVGGGLGFVGRALSHALAPRSYVVVDRSPSLARAQRARGLLSVVGDASHLPVADRAVDLVISNEMAGDLATLAGVNSGALELVDECARVLAPGGVAYLSEFGHPTRPPVRSEHLDHDEHSLRFEDLRARAVARGLAAELIPLPELIGLDRTAPALVTTRASFAALRALFAAHGKALAKRAWLRDEFSAALRGAAIDPESLHGIVTAPIGERTMGLKPDEFWALIARQPS